MSVAPAPIHPRRRRWQQWMLVAVAILVLIGILLLIGHDVPQEAAIRGFVRRPPEGTLLDVLLRRA
jgi:hypothetical protein